MRNGERKPEETGRSATLNAWKQGDACDQSTQALSQSQGQRQASVSLVLDPLE